ncbi:MAG: class I SAM-dependent methyltransferase [Candidatus Kaiserbacteria bacterium]|nr:class I SAM-dependent methyltransferase [Candidatus Kaiserbacteria bacterium]
MDVRGFADTIAWYDAHAEEYADSVTNTVPTELIELFLAKLPEHPFVLDAGCAHGRDSEAMAKRGANVVGVDISKPLLKIARERYPKIQFVQADFRKLPFDDGIFDGVWSQASLVHLESEADVRASIAEFARVLKLGGIAHICVRERTSKEATAVISDAVSNHERFFRFYTLEEMTDYLKDSGFVVLLHTNPPDHHGRDDIAWLHLLAQKVI